MRTSACIVLLLLLAFLACSSPQKMMPDDQKFMEVYADVLLAQGSYEMLVDSIKQRYSKVDTLSLVFASHGYAPEEFSRKMESYRSNPKFWQELQAKTIQLLEERKQRAVEERQKLQSVQTNSKAPLQ